jgi:hypothetical protein
MAAAMSQQMRQAQAARHMLKPNQLMHLSAAKIHVSQNMSML